MRYPLKFISKLFFGLTILIAAIFATANLNLTTVNFSPFPYKANIPLYVIILGAFGLGLIIGTSLCSFARQKLKFQNKKLSRKNMQQKNNYLKTPLKKNGNFTI